MSYPCYDKATSADIEAIALIEAQLFDDAWTAASIHDLLSQSINGIIFLKCDNEIVAYCLYQHIFEAAEILRIATTAKFQRQGLATQLLDTWLALMQQQGAQHCLLEVRADNTQAIALYQRLGFKQIDTRKNYYQNKQGGKGVDAWIMQRVL